MELAIVGMRWINGLVDELREHGGCMGSDDEMRRDKGKLTGQVDVERHVRSSAAG